MFNSFRYCCLTLGIALSGCAGQQLSYNTEDVNGRVSDLYTRDFLNNVSLFLDNKNAFPSHVLIAGGTIQTANAVNPSVTLPVTDQIATTLTDTLGASPALNSY